MIIQKIRAPLTIEGRVYEFINTRVGIQKPSVMNIDQVNDYYESKIEYF
jgi:hypothetical protein